MGSGKKVKLVGMGRNSFSRCLATINYRRCFISLEEHEKIIVLGTDLFRSAYTASKHALQAFCDSLRAEVAHHNVNVTVVSPGYVRTNLSVNALTDTGEKYGGKHYGPNLTYINVHDLCLL